MDMPPSVIDGTFLFGCTVRCLAFSFSHCSIHAHQNPSLKENLSKLKEAEQKLRENPSVMENLAKLKEAEQKFRDNPSVKENLSKLKDAEKKLREDAKSKQVQYRVLCLWSAALVR